MHNKTTDVVHEHAASPQAAARPASTPFPAAKRVEMAHEESPHKGKSGLTRLLNAFSYSLAGLKAAYRHEDAFRQEALLAAFLIPLAFYLTPDNLARAIMVGSVLLVLVVELINSAIEATVDRISLQDHILAKRAKDIGSAAVFVAIINMIAMWTLALAR